MKDMMYEQLLNTINELVRRIFDVARRVNEPDFPRTVTRSMLHHARMSVQADGGHFEQLLR